jgi:hypothetical protein
MAHTDVTAGTMRNALEWHFVPDPWINRVKTTLRLPLRPSLEPFGRPSTWNLHSLSCVVLSDLQTLLLFYLKSLPLNILHPQPARQP